MTKDTIILVSFLLILIYNTKNENLYVKKMKDEKGKTYIEKQPFYKKWLFWLIIIFIASAAFGGSEGAEKNK